MSNFNRVTVDANGFVNRQRTKKKLKPRREKHDFKASEQPRTHSHLIADVATTKGMRPLMKKAQDKRVSFNHTELNYDKIQLPTDHRAHPFIPFKAR